MKIETIRKNHKKEIIIGALAVCVVGGALTFATSKAKYKLTQDIPLVRGTVNYKVPDLRVVALYTANDSGDYIEANDIPTSGYTLNQEKSMCKVYDGTTSIENAPKDNNITIEYINGKINFLGLSKKNTRCYLYFDKINDNEKPIISNVTTNASQTEINITVTATDNIGVTEYWYQLDSNAAVKGAGNTHTFTGLTAGTNYNIKVYVKDAVGNTSDINTSNVSTKKAGTIIAKAFSDSSETIKYTHNSQTYELSLKDEEWIIPVGAIVDLNGKNVSVNFYGATTNSNDYLDYISSCDTTKSTYTITGNEGYYKAYFNCFTGDTELLAYDEKKKRKLKRKVKDFKVGDKLYTFDEKQNRFITTKIKKIDEVTTRDIYAIHLENGDIIRCSDHHAFYVANVGYMNANELKVGTSLLGIDKNYKIVKIEKEHYPNEITLYNLYLDNNTNCFVTSAKVLSYMMTLSLVSTTKKRSVVAVVGTPGC